MERAVQMEIFRNKRTIFKGSTSLFLFEPLERKLPFHLHKIFISTAHESARAYPNFLRHHDLPMRLQVFRPHGKSLSVEGTSASLANSRFFARRGADLCQPIRD